MMKKGAAAAAAVLALAAGARADGHEGCNTTIAEVATEAGLTNLVDAVTLVADDPELASEASTFLQKVTGELPDVDVTAFAPAQEAWDSVPDLPLGLTMATVLNMHAVPELMDEGEGYTTLAGAAQGKLTINGDTVEGPCNTGNVVGTVDVCGSVVHVVDQVLLPLAACGGDEDEADAAADASEDDGGIESEAEELFDAEDDASEDAAAPAPTDLVAEAFRPDENYRAELESDLGDGSEAEDTLDNFQQDDGGDGGDSGITLDDVVNVEIVAEATAPAPAPAPEENTAMQDLDYDVADESVGEQIDEFFDSEWARLP